MEEEFVGFVVMLRIGFVYSVVGCRRGEKRVGGKFRGRKKSGGT